MPLAHQARRKRRTTEDPEYEIKIQEAMDDLHSGSIRAAATALSKMCILNIIMCTLQRTTVTFIYMVEYLTYFQRLVSSCRFSCEV